MPKFTYARVVRGAAALALLTGGLIVTAQPADAAGTASATTQQELHDDFADGNIDTITIDFNGTIDSCGLAPFTRASNNAVTVMAGTGSTITQTCNTDVFAETGTADLAFSGLTIVGMPNHNVVISAGKITVQNSTISGFGGAGGNGLNSGVDVLLTNSSINGVNGGTGINLSGTATLNHSTINDVEGGDGVNGSVAVMSDSSINGITSDGNGLDVTDATLTDSSINSPSNDGCSGINSNTAVLTRSTITGCEDGINSSTASLTNSTVTGATTAGINAGTVTLVFSDVVGNALNIDARAVTSTASVVAKPGAGVNCNISTMTSHGFNFDDDGSCKFDQSTDQSDAGDPGLAALADNGGPTKTLLPQAGSKLLNKVPAESCSVTTDQRKVSRPQDTGCEVGSVEIAVEAPATPATPVEVQPSSLTG